MVTAIHVSTGRLPTTEVVREQLDIAYGRYREIEEGSIATYIPALASASPTWFSIAVAGVRGGVGDVGDADLRFSIQSVSKPFVFALICDELGHAEARERLGVNGTGMPFDSVVAFEMAEHHLTNPLVNAGALATTSLAPGDDPGAQWEFVRRGLSRFAGRDLAIDEEVYESERATNHRNRGLAHLLDGYGQIFSDPDVATDVYTRQCSLMVDVRDLATMGATLANGGVNPTTGDQVVDPSTCQRVLAVLATAGLYERTGEWLYDIGLPGKSGVSGGMVTISPGKGGLATYSPPLDDAGNSVRGQLATTYLSEALGLNLFASAPNHGESDQT